MAAGNLCVCVLLALLAGNFILAEEQEKNSMMDPFGFMEMFFGGGSRSKRSPNPEEDAAEEQHNSTEHQDRLFFSLFNFRLTSCNYTNANETGSTCRDNRTALRCLPSNVGILRFCSGLLPYCDGGRCTYRAASSSNSTSG